MFRVFHIAVLLLVAVGPLGAQEQSVLTLDAALDIAQRNNPQYQQSLTGRTRALAGTRAAYGALLPSADASAGASYREGRPQFFGGVAFGATSDILSSSWNLSANSRLSVNSFNNIRRANAQLDAADADVASARFALRANVTAQFLLALQTQARASLQDTLVVQQRLQLELAQARAGVGAATSLDVKRAEVGLGQQEVAALRARNTAEVERLRLFQQLGVPMPERVVLAASLPVEAPTFQIEELLTIARRENPALQATVARERVARTGVQSARGEYTPTLSLSASVGAFTQRQQDIDIEIQRQQGSVASARSQCFTTDSIRVGASMSSIAGQCAGIVWSPEREAAIRRDNNRFPFDFTRNPYNIALGLSLPLFDGLGRETRLQEAHAAEADARFSVKRQELQLTADVTSAFVTVQAAYQAVRLQERTAATAREALQLGEERYRVGANTFVDLTTARAEYERAETDRIDAIYEFHRAYAALENAVGRALR